jgi:hypothetical protein
MIERRRPDHRLADLVEARAEEAGVPRRTRAQQRGAGRFARDEERRLANVAGDSKWIELARQERMRRRFASCDLCRVRVEADVLHHRDERMPVRIEIEVAAAANIDEP